MASRDGAEAEAFREDRAAAEWEGASAAGTPERLDGPVEAVSGLGGMRVDQEGRRAGGHDPQLVQAMKVRRASEPERRRGPATEARFEQVRRTRLVLSLALLPPLLFFVFLVLWFHEGAVLIPVSAGLYLYMLAEFFVFQNPARLARERDAESKARHEGG